MKNNKWSIVIFLLCVFFFVLRWTDEISFQVGQDIDKDIGYKSAEITGELFISPYGVEKELLSIFGETKYSLQMWNYLVTEKTFLNMFANLSQMGVKVDVILENKIYGGRSKAFGKAKKKIEKSGGRVYSDEQMGTNFVHAKTMILDNKKFIIATANFTYPSLWRNREYRFVGTHTGVVKSLSNIFEKDLLGKKIKKKDIDKHLLICPIDCRKKISDALNSAKKSIQIQTQYIQDKDIVSLLKRQKYNGVNVQLLVGDKQDEGRLEPFGTGFKMLGKPYIHAKNILIDGELLLMGSANLSTNGLDNNREIGIIIDNPRVVKKFEGQFERDWKIGKIMGKDNF